MFDLRLSGIKHEELLYLCCQFFVIVICLSGWLPVREETVDWLPWQPAGFVSVVMT